MHRPAIEKERFSWSCLFGEWFGFLLKQNKEETMTKLALETSRRGPGVGAVCNAVLLVFPVVCQMHLEFPVTGVGLIAYHCR